MAFSWLLLVIELSMDSQASLGGRVVVFGVVMSFESPIIEPDLPKRHHLHKHGTPA
jgi:hypothetical protein